jgi:hypothetical protein
MKTNVVPFAGSTADCILTTAWVKGATGDSAMIEFNGGAVNAAIAFSCLVRPVAGDKVLVARTERECHVLAVLERSAGRETTIEFPGDARLSAPHGRMDFTAGTELNLIGAQRTRMVSADTRIMTGELDVSAGRFTGRSAKSEAHLGEARVFADSIDTVAKRITQRAETVMRWVEGVETLNIGSLIQNVRKIMMSHSHHAVITAKKDIKIDAERIHMG